MIDTFSSRGYLTLSESNLNMIRKLKKEGRIIQYFHSVNKKGFGGHFQQILNDQGIIYEPTVAYKLEQNEFVESFGNRICVVARTLGIQSAFLEEIWPELVPAAVYLLNKTPTQGLGWSTSFEKYKGYKPDVSHLKIVSCRAFVYIPRQKCVTSEKLAERAWIGYLIGFEAHNIWRI